MTIPKPKNEAARLAALDEYQVLDTPPEEAFDRITRLASSILQTPIALVSLVDEHRQWFKSRHGLDAEETPRETAFCAHAIMDNDVMVVSDTRTDARFFDNPLVTGNPDIRFYAGAPLKTPQGQNLGTLCVIDREPREIDEAQKAMLQDLAAMVVDELELRRLASVDQLTQALNRSRWFRLAERECRRAQRHDYAVSVLMMDIDEFKAINDRFGHTAGDEVLRNFSSNCRNLVREHDLFGGYGGEEFGLVAPYVDDAGAALLAERIRESTAKIEAAVDGQPINFTVSIGLTHCDSGHESFLDAVKRADEGLYDAKHQGRNRVVRKPAPCHAA